MLSARQRAEQTTRIAFEQKEQVQEREQEDKKQYQIYVTTMTAEGESPLGFEEWRSFIPTDLANESAAVRGLLASTASNWARCVSVTTERIASAPLDDAELGDLGFDLRDRVNYDIELSPAAVAASFEPFRDEEDKFVPSVHLKPVGNFLYRNHLEPNLANIRTAFELLLRIHVIEHVEAPEPQPTPERRVNLRIEPDPETERWNRIRDYEEKPVARYDNQDFTQKQLDAMSSEEYLKIMRVPRFRGVLVPDRLY